MEINCDKCEGPTKAKQITSKKTGKTYTVYVCLSGCKTLEGFPYSCFAPKELKNTEPVQPGNQMLQLLEEIKAICLAMNSKLPPKVVAKRVEEDSY